MDAILTTRRLQGVRLRPWHWTALDVVIGALCLIPIITGAGRGASPDNPLLDSVAVTCSLLFVARRRYPVLVFVLLAVGMIALGTSGRGPYNEYEPIGLMLTLSTVAARRPRWLAAIAGTSAVAMAVYIMLSRHSDLGTIVLTACTVGIAPALAGYFKSQSLVYAEALRTEQARKIEAEVTASLTAERMRIARELHDVVAHALSLITLQAGVAVFREHDEARLRETLSSVESTGRGALVDMRRLLGVLRGTDHEPAPAELAPAPGLADLGALVSQTAQAGLSVRLHIDGRRRPLPAGVELAAYRIVQESLTNVLRHGRTPQGTVVIGYDDEALTVNITNPGPAGMPAAPARTLTPIVPGHGLSGMAERAAIYGGRMVAVRTPGGGFSVTARFPVPLVPDAETGAGATAEKATVTAG